MTPETRAGLLAADYKQLGIGFCRSCEEAIEWWINSAGNKIPMTLMEAAPDCDTTGAADRLTIHYGTCEARKAFSKAKAEYTQRTLKPKPKQGSLYD